MQGPARFGILACAILGCTHLEVAPEHWPAALKRAWCEGAVRCGDFPDVATCVGANLGFASAPDPSFAAAIATGKIVWDAGKAGDCFRAIAAQSCDHTAEDNRVAPAVCGEIAHGTVGAGGACGFGGECISGQCAPPSTNCEVGCCTGTCVGDTPFRSPVIGEACTATGPSCAPGAYCDTTLAACAPLKPAGASCAGGQCAYGLACVGDPAPTCRSLPTLGEPCPDGACRDAGTHCDATGTCARVGLPPAPCASADDCSVYYTCDATGACAEGPHVGEPCSPSGPLCFDAGSFCSGSTLTCTPVQPDGSYCVRDDECQSGSCDTTTATCAAKRPCI